MSGIVVLEKLKHDLNRCVNIYAEIIIYRLISDGNHMTFPSGNIAFIFKKLSLKNRFNNKLFKCS